MSEPYEVRPGDHMVKIAVKFKFSTYRTIWNDDSNSDLKTLRKNPHILFAGDIVVFDDSDTGTPADQVKIPDKKPNEAKDLSTEKSHKFELQTDKLDLHLVIKDENDKVLSGIECDCPADGSKVTSDGGKVDALLISQTAELGVLKFKYKTIDLSTRGTDPDPAAPPLPDPPNPDPDPDPPLDPAAKPVFPAGDFDVLRGFALGIGYLDPLDRVTGVQARLNNLGYYAGDIGYADEDAQALQLAIEEFELDHKAPVTGKADDTGMQKKLKDEHGC